MSSPNASLHHSILGFCLVMMHILALPACSQQEKTTLSSTEIRMADTLFKKNIPLLDSIAQIQCDSIESADMDQLVDSFYQLNLQDVQNYYDLK